MQVDASCKQMIRPVHAMMQIVRYLPPSSSGELVGSHSQEAVAGTVTCWASKSWLVVQFPGLEKLLISECGNASVGKKKVEKLRLIQGISNSKRKSVYRGIILKSQEELVNVRVFNDSWNANNTPAYSLVQTQSLMLWTVLINGILSHEETDMRPFRLPMLSPNPFRRDLNVALWWLIAGFVANQLTEFWDFLLPDLHVVDLTRWQHLSQLGYHRIIHTEYESGMIRYDSTLRFPPLPYWWIRDHAIRLCQGQCLQCVPQVRQNRRAKFPSLRMYEWLQVDIEFNWAKNIKNSPHLGTSLRCQQWPCRVQVPRNKDVWRVTSRHLSAFQAFHLHRVKKSSQPKENLRTKQSQKQKISTDTNPPCPTLTQKVGGKLEPLVPSKLEMLEARWIPRWPEEHLELQSKWCKQRVMSCAAICTEWWDSSNRFYVVFKILRRACWKDLPEKLVAPLWLLVTHHAWCRGLCWNASTCNPRKSPHLGRRTLGPQNGWVCLSTSFTSLRLVLNRVHRALNILELVGWNGDHCDHISVSRRTVSRTCIRYQWHSLDYFQDQRNHFVGVRRPENSLAISAVSIFSTFSGGSFDSFRSLGSFGSFGSLLPLPPVEARPGRRRLIPEGSIMRCNLSAKLSICAHSHAIWNKHQFEDDFRQTRIPETSRDNSTLNVWDWLWLSWWSKGHSIQYSILLS